MLGWYYNKQELKHTPSALDNINEDTELEYRKQGIKLIVNIGKELDMNLEIIATGALYFHRFYMFHSFKQFSQYITACGCIFLATKVHETPEELTNVIKTAHSLLNAHEFSSFQDDPRKEVIELELNLLQTLQFDLDVQLPYNYLINFSDCFTAPANQVQQILQIAWGFVNNSLFTTLVLQWEPEILAIAFLYLAGKLSELEIEDWCDHNKHLHWWNLFIEDISEEVLEDICHQILDV